MHRSKIASSPIAAWRTAAEQAKTAPRPANRVVPLPVKLRPAAPEQHGGRPQPASFSGIASHEPLLYYWQRNRQLAETLTASRQYGPLTEADATVLAVHGLRHHYDNLLKFLPETAAADMAIARDTVTTMQEFTTAAGALALQQTYNQRAAELGKQLFEFSAQISYTTVQLPETATGQQP